VNPADLRALGVEVSLSEEGKVRLRAAPGVLTPQLKQAIVEAKPRLLDELRRHRQEPVNVVNMVNFDAHCLTTGIGPSPASKNDHRAPASDTVTRLKQPGALLDGGLSSEGETAVLAWLAQIGESDEAIVGDVLAQCRHDADARQYFLGRAGEIASPSGWTTGGAVTNVATCALASASSPSLAESARRSADTGQRWASCSTDRADRGHRNQ